MTKDTLNDVFHQIPALYSESSAKAYAAAFRRVERLTGRKLHQIPANVPAWDAMARSIVWAGEFRAATPQAAERAFETWKGKISAAIRRAAEAEGKGQGREPDVAASWDLLIAHVRAVENTFDDLGQRILPNMGSLSLQNLRARLGHVAPAQIDRDIAIEALRAIPADKTATYRRSLRFLDRLIGERDRHDVIATLLPKAPIGPLPGLRDAALDWSAFSEEFRASRDAMIRNAIAPAPIRRDRFAGRLGTDPLAHRRGGAARRTPVRNPEARRKAYLNALSWLIRHAFPDRHEAYGAQNLPDLLTPDTIEAAVAGFQARAEASDSLKRSDETSSLWSILANLETLAKRNSLDENLLYLIEDLRADAGIRSDHVNEMSTTRAAFVKLLDRDPAIARAIVTGPRVLLREARRGLTNWEGLGAHAENETLHMSMAAAMLALQLARPLRTRNINEMTSGGTAPELIEPRREALSAWIEIGKNRVKNRRVIEHEIPRPLWEVVSLWISEGRSRWCQLHGINPDQNPHLFPGLKAGEAASRGLINKIWNRGMSRLGVPGLTPHMMRHVAATLYLAREPGRYEVVAALLCDKISTIEKFYARGEGAEAARLFAGVLAELDPTLPLSRKKKAS